MNIPEPKAFAAWCCEVEAAGGERGAFARVAEQLGCNRASLCKMAAKYRWRERYRKIVAPAAMQRENERAIDAVSDWRAAQIQTGEALRKKGLEALQNMTPNTVREAHDLVKLGSELVAKAHDTGTKTVEVNHSLKALLLPPAPDPVPLPAPERPRIKVEVAEDIEDLLSDEERRSVLEEGEE